MCIVEVYLDWVFYNQLFPILKELDVILDCYFAVPVTLMTKYMNLSLKTMQLSNAMFSQHMSFIDRLAGTQY